MNWLVAWFGMKIFFIMLLSHARYKTFIGEKEIADTKSSSAALISFTFSSAQSVKDFGKLANENGGKSLYLDNGISEEMMYGLEVQDLDGNCLEPVWMNSEMGKKIDFMKKNFSN